MIRLLVALILSLQLLLPPAAQTALDRDVAAPGASFAWQGVEELPPAGATATPVDPTSQRWRTPRAPRGQSAACARGTRGGRSGRGGGGGATPQGASWCPARPSGAGRRGLPRRGIGGCSLSRPPSSTC